MGFSKVVVNSPRSVTFVHQLDDTCQAYAEDITITLQSGVPESRLAYWRDMEGLTGTVTLSFTPTPYMVTAPFPVEGEQHD